MSKIKWDQTGERLYETGVEQGVLYPMLSGAYQTGVAWNGLINVTESPEGGEPTALYADNKKYLNLMSTEEAKLNIEAYTYPDEFEPCNGSVEVAPGVYVAQQDRESFGFSYKTLIGNDTEYTSHGYKLHLAYGCLASPSEKAHGTVNENPEAGTFSWDVSTTPVEIATLINGKKLKPTATLTIDSTKTDADKLAALEALLYGSEDKEPTLPTPDEVIALVGAVAAG